MRIASISALAIALVLAVLAGTAAFAQDPAPAKDTAAKDAAAKDKFNIWVYYHPNLGDDKSLDKTLKMVERAAKAGYTGFVLVENKMQRWSQVTPKYLANMKKFRQACRDNKIDCVAAVTPLGYANDLLSNDVNLAEAVPVVDAPFIVKDGKIVPDDPIKLANGDFTEGKGDAVAGWNVDLPGKCVFWDKEVKYNGKPSVRMEDIGAKGEGGHARINQQFKVKPFQNYIASVAVKTKDNTNQDVRLMALGAGEAFLNMPELHPEKTQDWKVYTKTFNTQDLTEFTLYVGSWGGKTGTLWFADVKLEPAGMMNAVRRDSLPFKATSPDGKTVYAEGKDLPKMVDPGTGHSPYLGGYQYHEPPTLKLPEGSTLKDGDKLLLTYANTAVMEYGDQVPICMSEPKTYELIKAHIEGVKKNLDPDAYFMEHDEIRMCGWDACAKSTPGAVLAENIKKVADIIQTADKGKPMFVWSDMFDPHHNAQTKGRYQLCKGDGPWNGSWKGLPKEVGLINWNAGKPASIEFFSTEGHPQILSGVDPATMLGILKKSGSQKGVVGVMYTTWSDDFSNLEKYAKTALEWKAAQK